ncbi:MAG: hypothetical protein LBN95_05020 [Prevotellaceae bacterium]|nr:hypothetical protein [Prevotellaceae bacterium]
MIHTAEKTIKAANVAAEPEIKWTAQMQESFMQAANGEWKIGDINNFWAI